ncbi:unnamed protein product [Rotaria sp. Silwood2]|nr:unnamed protein product [Rotaria sp. Silwood2]CAF4477871.1 unnamed protein product [Rotaria sp. Silwood2]
MSPREFFALAFILYILVVQLAANRVHVDEDDSDDDDDDNEYGLVKRIFFHKHTTASTERTPSILDNLIRPSSTYSPTEKPISGTQKSTSSSSFSSLDPCDLNPCENEGICIRKGQMTYECKCVGPWRGMHCGIDRRVKMEVHVLMYRMIIGANVQVVITELIAKQVKFNSPSYSENYCRPNICQAGRCISLQTTYYCECPHDRSGEHCEKQLFKREILNMRLYRNLIQNLKRGMTKPDTRKFQGGHSGDVAYYDAKNGIYF